MRNRFTDLASALVSFIPALALVLLFAEVASARERTPKPLGIASTGGIIGPPCRHKTSRTVP